MVYFDFKTPYISDKDIETLAEKIRSKFWKEGSFVDVEKLLMKLKIDVVPIKDLVKNTGIDSFITSDWKNIYVDNDDYLDDYKYRRVRFSMAHELGHLFLHKGIYETFKIKSLEDYYSFYKNVSGDQYSFLETQANIFASHFLVPRKRLEEEKEKIIIEKKRKLEKSGLKGDFDLMEYVIDDLAEKFNVSRAPIEIAIGRRNNK